MLARSPQSPVESVEPKQASTTAAKVPAPADSFKAAPAEAPKPAAQAAREKAPAPAAVVPPPSQPAPKAPVNEEVPLLATTLRTEQPKAKVAPIKAEEPAKAAPAAQQAAKARADQAGGAAKKVDEPKKAAPRAEDPVHDGAKPRSPAEAKSAPANKKIAAKDAEPGSRRPASLRAVPVLDDDLDPSSISSAFFRKDQDSVPPIEEHEEHDSAPVPVLSPSTLARRARLRRVVAGVVAFAGVISIAVVGKQVSASKRPVSVATAEVKVAPPALEEAKPPPADEPVKVAAATEPAKVDGDPKAAGKPDDKVDEKKADEPAKADDAKKADEKKADEPAKADDAKKADDKPAPSAADADALRKETLALLNRGRTKDAIAKAREAIAADPTDATAYEYLGSALQDSGKWKDGIEAYCDCVRNATKGPVNECRAMGGHK